jgi:hypothetical protein
MRASRRVGKADIRPSGGNRAERFTRASSAHRVRVVSKQLGRFVPWNGCRPESAPRRAGTDSVGASTDFPAAASATAARIPGRYVYEVRLKPDTTLTGPLEGGHYEFREPIDRAASQQLLAGTASDHASD